MKLKTLAIMAVSGLFAASIAYADPSKVLTADDTAAMSGAGMSGTPAMNGAPAPSDMAPIPSANASGNVGAPADSSNDDMSADTATGDDDY